MKFHLGDMDFETGDDKDRVHAIIKNLFWLLLAWILLSMLRPQTAATWIKYYKKKAGDLKASWGTKIARWASLALDTITDWGTWLLEGGLTLIRWTLITCAVLLGLYLIVGLGYLPVLAPALTMAVAIAALLLVLAVQIIPGALLPGDKQRTREVFGVMGMWPIAICFAFVCFPFTWTGTFIWMVALLGMFYLLKGGQIRFARIAASVVLWSAVLFKGVELGLPAIKAGAFGGAASEIAGKVMNWNEIRGAAEDIQADEHRARVGKTRGVAVDTIRTIVLNLPSKQKVSYTIPPGDVLEVLGVDSIEWNTGYKIEVKLVRLKDTDGMDRFVDTYQAASFFVPWGSVKADESISPYSGNAPGGAGATTEPVSFILRATVAGRDVGGSVELAEADVTPVDGGVEVTIPATAVGVRLKLPAPAARGDELVFEYIGGTYAANQVGGGPDPKFNGHYDYSVGPEGYPPDPVMAKAWSSANQQLVNGGAQYDCLLWSSAPSANLSAPVFAPYENESYHELSKPVREIYLVFNETWYHPGHRWGSVSTYLKQAASRRTGSVTIRVSVSKAGAGTEAGAA